MYFHVNALLYKITSTPIRLSSGRIAEWTITAAIAAFSLIFAYLFDSWIVLFSLIKQIPIAQKKVQKFEVLITCE